MQQVRATSNEPREMRLGDCTVGRQAYDQREAKPQGHPHEQERQGLCDALFGLAEVDEQGGTDGLALERAMRRFSGKLSARVRIRRAREKS